MNRADNRTLLLTVLAVILVLALVPVLMMGGGWMLGGMMGGWNGSSVTWPAGAGLLVVGGLVIGGLAALGAWVAQRRPAAGDPGSDQGDPLAILKQRYARGELTREQYEQMKRDLQAD